MLTILLWIFGISLLINELDYIFRKHSEYYWYMIKRYSNPDHNILQKTFNAIRVVIKGTIMLPFFALLTFI